MWVYTVVVVAVMAEVLARWRHRKRRTCFSCSFKRRIMYVIHSLHSLDFSSMIVLFPVLDILGQEKFSSDLQDTSNSILLSMCS